MALRDPVYPAPSVDNQPPSYSCFKISPSLRFATSLVYATSAMKNSKYPDISLGQSIINGNIFFGPEIWPLQSQGGISRYNAELIKGMSSINQKTFAFLPENRNQFIDLIPDQSKILTNRTKTSDLIETALKKIKKESHNSIYHATYFGNAELKLWQRAGFKTVITVHD